MPSKGPQRPLLPSLGPWPRHSLKHLPPQLSCPHRPPDLNTPGPLSSAPGLCMPPAQQKTSLPGSLLHPTSLLLLLLPWAPSQLPPCLLPPASCLLPPAPAPAPLPLLQRGHQPPFHFPYMLSQLQNSVEAFAGSVLTTVLPAASHSILLSLLFPGFTGSCHGLLQP